MKFKDPIEQKLNDEISIFVPSAWLNSKGFPMGEVQIWNGTLTHSDTLCLANSAARTRFIKSAVKRVAVPEAKIEEVLLLIGGNLTTRLAEDLEAERADEGRAPSQSTQLVELAADAELFHSPDGEGYATINVGSHKETWPIKAKGFRRWLMRRYYEQTKSSANAQALQDALGVLEGKALFDGQQHRVYTRIAEAQGNIYVDLANESWEAVEIAATGWRVVAESPVKFRRAKGMLALPHPVAGGSIDELRSFININEAEWPLVIECETAAFRPSGPYPVVILQGEQGSAKSTAARVLRSLVDPNVAPLRSEPRDDRDLMIAATNGWLVALDNLSHVSQSLSNGLCRLATGGGFATRELYSDSDEVLFDAMRPVLLTGIEELATQSDLADRAVILNLPVIEETERRPEKEFWRDFEEARPKILGALLDAVSTALRNVDSVRLARLPRMADFAIWATAAEPALGLKSGAFR